MTPETMFLLGLLILWSIAYAVGQFLHADQHGFRIFPFFLTYRSEKFKSVITKIGERNELLWKTLGNVSIALGLGLIIYVTYFLAGNLVKFFQPVMQSVPVVPVVPAITIRLDSMPYFFVAVTIAVVLHELAHGISAITEKIFVKSAGLAFMLAFFGGFVEPDEKSFEKSSKTSRLRMLGAGSAVNLVTGLLVLLLLTGAFAPSVGVLVDGTVEEGPLALAGVKRFDVIYAVNNTEVKTLQELADYLKKVTPGANLTLKINDYPVPVPVTTMNSSKRAVIGLSYGVNYHPCHLGLDRVTTANVYLILYWTFLVAFSVAVFNMLPLFPFDGEKFIYQSLENFVGKEKRLTLRVAINAVFLSLLVANMALSFWYFGLQSA